MTDASDGDSAHAVTPRIGVCYFPEHWPRERWEADVEEMVEAGIEVVRMAEFAWGCLEPSRGEFDFEWLDEVVGMFGEADVDVVLCTPTATPPKWLVDERPEILQAEPDGMTRAFGSRRHYCFNSPTYREETERIVRTMAERYADNEHVVGWQTDNEYGCNYTVRCYCDDCARAFRAWLEEEYGSIEALNEAWGTTFWSQQYDSFEAVDPPRHTAASHHPSRLLDYARFSSDSVVSYNSLQSSLLREANPEWFVTHNFMGNFPTLDAHDVGDDLDFAAWDSYPTGFVQDRRTGDPVPRKLRAGDPDQLGLNHDLYRDPGNPRGFWVMEQQPGDINWPPYGTQPAEGTMRLWAHHAVAHGAEVVSFFRWRRCREGQEQYHAGLRKHDGTPDRGYDDATRVASELRTVANAARSSDGAVDADETANVGGRNTGLGPVRAPVALLHEYDDLWALSEQPHAPDFEYWTHFGAYYRALRARGIGIDVVHPTADLDPYACVLAPTLHLVDGGLATHLGEYVRDGGHLLATIRTGLKDPRNKLHEALAPGPLADLFGVRVSQHESLPPALDCRVTYRGAEYDYRTFAEWLAVDSGGAEDADNADDGNGAPATVRGRFETGVRAGRPAIAERAVGEGSAAYCGVWPEADLADALVTDLLDRADLAHTERLPDGVRLAERDSLTWVTNFTSEPIEVAVHDADPQWLLGDSTVEAYDVAIVHAPATSVTIATDD